MTIFYHFTKDTLRDGSPVPPVGEWLRFKGEPIICVQGLHASRHVADALKYAPGFLLHRVELEGVAAEQDDKVVAKSRKIVATIDATEMLRRYARLCALDVIHLWNAPDVVRQYLETGDESLRGAAAAEAAEAAARAAWAAGAARAAAWAAQAEAEAMAAAWVAGAAWAAWAAWAEAAWAEEEEAATAHEKYRVTLSEMVDEEFAKVAK